MSAVVKQSLESLASQLKAKSHKQVAIQTCLSSQLEVGILQLPRALRQPGKMLLNKILAKLFFFFFFKRNQSCCSTRCTTLIYFSFWIPVTSWPCFQFCFTSEIEVLQLQSCNCNLWGETWWHFSFPFFSFWRAYFPFPEPYGSQ